MDSTNLTVSDLSASDPLKNNVAGKAQTPEVPGKPIHGAYHKNMDDLTDKMGNIKESILKFVPARYIYLFGSYAYGHPTEESDIDIYLVVPDDTGNLLQIYGKIMGDLSDKKMYFVDLLLNRESVFNIRKVENILEETVYQKGKMIYEN